MTINKIYETDPVEVYNEEGEQLFESAILCTIPDENDFEDFCYMTHEEQVNALSLIKEKAITNKTQSTCRYNFYIEEHFIIVIVHEYIFY